VGRKAASVRRRPPQLEALEDRVVPSTFSLAVDDWIDTDGSAPVTVAVLANDSPATGAHLLPNTVAVVSGPAHGSATVDHNTGPIISTPASTFSGTDTFRSTVRDDAGGLSSPATVSVRVNRPTAADDWTDTDGTAPVTIDVLENDQDPEGHDAI